MSDRTSAGIFVMIFELLAENPTAEHKEIARKIWPATFMYDFSTCQMGVENALITATNKHSKRI